MYRKTTEEFARAYYHWFFLIQPAPLPEHLIGLDPEFYLRKKIGAGSAGMTPFARAALEEYRRCFCREDMIAATCEDYRASASIDLEHDAAGRERKLDCPLMVLWGKRGVVERCFDVLGEWRERDARGHAILAGHYLPKEVPELVTAELRGFFDDVSHRLSGG